jgi:hypothetical protein
VLQNIIEGHRLEGLFGEGSIKMDLKEIGSELDQSGACGSIVG